MVAVAVVVVAAVVVVVVVVVIVIVVVVVVDVVAVVLVVMVVVGTADFIVVVVVVVVVFFAALCLLFWFAHTLIIASIRALTVSFAATAVTRRRLALVLCDSLFLDLLVDTLTQSPVNCNLASTDLLAVEFLERNSRVSWITISVQRR